MQLNRSRIQGTWDSVVCWRLVDGVIVEVAYAGAIRSGQREGRGCQEQQRKRCQGMHDELIARFSGQSTKSVSRKAICFPFEASTDHSWHITNSTAGVDDISCCCSPSCRRTAPEGTVERQQSSRFAEVPGLRR